MGKKQILLINDMAGCGKVATAAMLPILSYMGHPVCNLPTMLISNNFERGRYAMMETTDYMRQALGVWRELGLTFDAIATGFVVSERQVKLVLSYCREAAAQGTAVFVDPIMGDEGKLYNGSTETTVRLMREMLSVAHLCYPNYTEACYLTGTSFRPGGVTGPEARTLVDALRTLGARSVLITSITVDGQTAVVGYNHLTDEHFLLPYNEIPVHFPGTGDIFSAVLIGHLLNGERLSLSTRKAMDAVYRLIDLNRDMPDKNLSIPIEQDLSRIADLLECRE